MGGSLLLVIIRHILPFYPFEGSTLASLQPGVHGSLLRDQLYSKLALPTSLNPPIGSASKKIYQDLLQQASSSLIQFCHHCQAVQPCHLSWQALAINAFWMDHKPWRVFRRADLHIKAEEGQLIINHRDYDGRKEPLPWTEKCFSLKVLNAALST